MDKTLIKLYIIIAVLVLLAVILIPAIGTRTSAWVSNAITEVGLIAYNLDQAQTSQPDDSRGAIVFVMDDGWETQYTCGYEMLGKYGMKGSIAVIPAAVGEKGYMDYSQLAELYKAGWDMLNHTYSHCDLSVLGEGKIKEEIIKGSGWLSEHHLKRGSEILIFPGGRFSELTLKVLTETGVAAARSRKSVWVTQLGCTLDDAEICNLYSNMTLENVTEQIDKAANNKSVLIIMMHKIEPVTDDTGMQFDVEMFRSIVDYVASDRDRLSVITMSELLLRENIITVSEADNTPGG